MARREVDVAAWERAVTAVELIRVLFPDERASRGRAKQRKLRLAICGVCRSCQLDLRLTAVDLGRVGVAERFADGLVSARQLRRAQLATDEDALHWAFDVDVYAYLVENALRALPDRASGEAMPVIRDIFPATCVKVPKRWRTSTVLAVARGAYDDRAFDRLPVLADALEDAGCDSEPLLAHLRGPGPHVRGCWALDAVLGKA